MILTTTETIPGYSITEIKGLVQANRVVDRTFGRGLRQQIRDVIGGVANPAADLVAEVRKLTIDDMAAEARRLEANAIVNIRFSTIAVANTATELHVYGTAVRVKELGQM